MKVALAPSPTRTSRWPKSSDNADDGEDVGGGADARAAIAERDRVIGEARREMQIVEHHDDRLAALARERRHDVERRDLLAEVEVRRGLVEKEDLRVLRDERGERQAAAFAAR